MDAACEENNKLSRKPFFCGLKDSWRQERVFCNPPFSKKSEWIKKAHDEVLFNDCPVCVMLLPTNSMSASFWEMYIYGKFHFEVISGRVCFIDPETGKEKKGPDSGTTIVYFMKRITNKDNDLSNLKD